MDIFIARQPIFNKKLDIYAYELLFRDGIDNLFPDIDGDLATSRVLSQTFFNTGIERITGGKKAFINFGREPLIRGIPLMFPSSLTSIEVLESVEPDESLIESCHQLKQKGFSIVLDDFVYHKSLDGLIKEADLIKIDFQKSSRDTIKANIEQLSSFDVKLIAEKVETIEEFDEALEMGFSYFQGYFFCKPQVLREKDVPAIKSNLLDIIAELNNRDFCINTLKNLVERDVGVSYKLLRHLNSPYYRRLCEITSVRHAIVLLGEKSIRQFLSVIIMSGLSSDKPDELTRSSIIRAKFCEQLGNTGGIRPDPSELFTLGLFSLIDAILDNHMGKILKTLPLNDRIKHALLDQDGDLRDYIQLAISYERGSWIDVIKSASSLNINPDKIAEIYIEALSWADSFDMSSCA
ncbi:MAG: HDOD domain-containing protein [Deltaproteobacteria bacterium]|nr:HDOD domain-containing protein [Deltaproteobacteria bacterium]